MRLVMSLLCVLVLAACGSDENGQDPPIDAAIDSDGDIPTGTTACGNETCNAASEICVITGPFGPSNDYACETVPLQCLGNRTCDCLSDLLCGDNIFQCTDAQENELNCDNGSQ
jgi:hypothetical protein